MPCTKIAQRSEAKPGVRFAKAEKDFLGQNELCYVATSHNDSPHVTPVNFIFNDGSFCFVTDYESRKIQEPAKNKSIALLVDTCNSTTDNKAVVIQGSAEVNEKDREFQRMYDMFYKKFDWVRDDP